MINLNKRYEPIYKVFYKSDIDFAINHQLKLLKVNNILSSDLIELLEVLHTVIYLDLSGYKNLNEDIFKVIGNLKELEVLILADSETVQNSSIQNLGSLNSIKEIDFSFCNEITKIGIEGLLNMKDLKSLVLDFCYQIEDTALKVLSNIKNLQRLSLVSCEEITDDGLKQLCELSELRELTLPEFSSISDRGIKMLVRELSHLRKLRIANLENFTNNGLFEIANSSIEELDISYCSKISASGILKLTEMKNLKQLIIKNIDFDTSIINKLKLKLPNCKILIQIDGTNF